MAWYLRIVPLQEPFDLGPSPNDHAQWAFNVLCRRAYGAGQVAKELAAVLQAAGVATYGVDMFVSSNAVVPSGVGPYVFITMTGGAPPIFTHGQAVPHQQQPGAQVLVRALDSATRTPSGASAAAEAKARAAYAALVAVVNQNVTAVT